MSLEKMHDICNKLCSMFVTGDRRFRYTRSKTYYTFIKVEWDFMIFEHI